MKKYNIEDNIDFYSELNKLLNKDNSVEEGTKNKEEVCLISNEVLTDKFVKLNCGHCFNYIPLYKDLVNQKQKFNIMEISEIKKDEIRCPYCRTKQQGVLTYYEELGLPKVNGVNIIEVDKINLCEYSIPNLNFNPLLPEDYATGNVKNLVCLNVGTKIMGKNYGDDKHYCSYHKKVVIHYAKEDLKLLKLKAKEDLKQEKIKQKILKQQATKEKKLKKIKATDVAENKIISSNIFENNVIIDLSENIIITEKCSQIIKTGKNKNKECGCKTYIGNLCKRHYNLNAKIKV
jgi:hypothetical protein